MIENLSEVQKIDFDHGWYDIIDKNHFWFEWRLSVALKLIYDLNIPTNQPIKVLEVGCGTGILRSALESVTNWKIDAADKNMPALQSCVPSRGRTLYYDIIDEHPSLVETYDVIILFDVLEHIPETKNFLASLLRHLTPGGYLLINVPALQSFFSHYDVRMGHLRRYNKKSLAAELSSFDVKILDERYWGFLMLPLLGIRKLLTAFIDLKEERLVKIGFKPANWFFDLTLRFLKNLELSLFPKPPIGTSLLLAARKGN